MKTQSKPASQSSGGSLKSLFTVGAIIVEFILAVIIYIYVLGDSSHFQGGDINNHPIDTFGVIYRGGVLVPLLITLALMVITFGIERAITISIASGKGSTQNFVRKIKNLVEANNVDQALSE